MQRPEFPAAFLGRIVECADVVVCEAVRLVNDPARTGGFLTLLEGDGSAFSSRQIGAIARAEKREKYERLAKEKNDRLFGHMHHRSSHQSRNPAAGEWGGSIRTRHLLISFSGLPELWDEGVSLTVAVLLGCFGVKEAAEIAEISENPYFHSLLYATLATLRRRIPA